MQTILVYVPVFEGTPVMFLRILGMKTRHLLMGQMVWLPVVRMQKVVHLENWSGKMSFLFLWRSFMQGGPIFKLRPHFKWATLWWATLFTSTLCTSINFWRWQCQIQRKRKSGDGIPLTLLKNTSMEESACCWTAVTRSSRTPVSGRCIAFFIRLITLRLAQNLEWGVLRLGLSHTPGALTDILRQ